MQVTTQGKKCFDIWNCVGAERYGWNVVEVSEWSLHDPNSDKGEGTLILTLGKITYVGAVNLQNWTEALNR
jgi:hypothetical protein